MPRKSMTDADWDKLIKKAESWGVLKFHRDGVAVLTRPLPSPPDPEAEEVLPLGHAQ